MLALLISNLDTNATLADALGAREALEARARAVVVAEAVVGAVQSRVALFAAGACVARATTESRYASGRTT